MMDLELFQYHIRSGHRLEMGGIGL
jgi:hypothetical protein